MEEELRRRIYEGLIASGSPLLIAFAERIFAREGTRFRCWGNLADDLDALQLHDEASIALWNVLLDVGDRRALLLFLDRNRTRRMVLRAVLDALERIPAIIQCALVSLPEARVLLEPAPLGLHPAARELLDRDAYTLAGETAFYAAQIAALRGQRAAAPALDDSDSCSSSLTGGSPKPVATEPLE